MGASDGGPGMFVRLLMEASGDRDPESGDLALAELAGDWLLRHGWREQKPLSYLNDAQGLWFRPWRDGIDVLRRTGDTWDVGRVHPVWTFAQALNTLAVPDILPPRFSTFGRDALLAAVTTFETTAGTLDELAGMPEFDHLEYAAIIWREAASALQRMAEQRIPEGAGAYRQVAA